MRFARAEEELHEKNPQTEPLTRGAKLVRDLERERERVFFCLWFLMLALVAPNQTSEQERNIMQVCLKTSCAETLSFRNKMKHLVGV